MKQLNLQERKFNIIEQLIILNDEEIFKQVEELIQTAIHNPELKRFTKQELEYRAKISEENIENGQIFSQEEVEKLSQNW
jgi:redox-regulated HSP33 family molecular chaperone